MKLTHECPEWDFLEIDEGSWEMFVNCPCYDYETRKAAAKVVGVDYDQWHREENEYNERKEITKAWEVYRGNNRFDGTVIPPGFDAIYWPEEFPAPESLIFVKKGGSMNDYPFKATLDDEFWRQFLKIDAAPNLSGSVTIQVVEQKEEDGMDKR